MTQSYRWLKWGSVRTENPVKVINKTYASRDVCNILRKTYVPFAFLLCFVLFYWSSLLVVPIWIWGLYQNWCLLFLFNFWFECFTCLVLCIRILFCCLFLDISFVIITFYHLVFIGNDFIDNISDIYHKLPLVDQELLTLSEHLSSPLVFSVYSILMYCRSLFVLLSFSFSPLCCMYFFHLWILITPLVSSNSS
jgi:hypothetical protein